MTQWYEWTWADERKFIIGLKTSLKLHQYIKAHQRSPHEHHQKGVRFARLILSEKQFIQN